MNVLIIFCHPKNGSYTHQVLEALKAEFVQKNWSSEISDLYAMNFQSDMSEREYEREGFSKIELPISPDVVNEHRKIDRADCVIFLYPNWWSDCPAKLKGWFDRVFSVGYAYKQTTNFPRMSTVKYGVAICTAGYSNEYLEENGFAQSMETIMLDDRLGKRFENKELIILGGTLDLEKVKHRHIQQLKEVLNRIELHLR